MWNKDVPHSKQLTSLEGSIPSSSTECTQHDTRSGVDNEVLIGIKMIPLAHQKSYVVKILAEPTDYGSMRGSIPLSGAKINKYDKIRNRILRKRKETN